MTVDDCFNDSAQPRTNLSLRKLAKVFPKSFPGLKEIFFKVIFLELTGT
jgi:hypothetical protein